MILGGFYAPVDWTNDLLIPDNCPKSIYVATMVGVYKSEVTSDSFKQIDAGLDYLHINSIEMDKSSRLYAGCEGGLYVLKNRRWEKILNEPFIRKIFISSKTILIGTNVGKVLRSPDCGKSWKEVINFSSSITKITSSGKTIYISSYNNGVYKSSDDGISWTMLEFKGKMIWDIIPVDNSIFIAGEEGLFMGSNTNWLPLNNGLTTKDIRVIAKDSKKNILYLGSYIGGFFISYNNGSKWYPANTGLSNTNIRDIAISKDSIYLATENGFYKTENGGKSFKKLTNGLIYMSPPPLSKSPEEIRKRKERLGIKPPAEAGGPEH